jgi:hypothetical protein
MIGSSYLYLEISLNSAETDGTESDVPYAAPLPDSVGLLFVLPENTGYIFYLNFLESSISVVNIENVDGDKKEYYGYPVSYEFSVDYRFFANFIDRVGGVEIYDSGETLRYTGMQIIEKIQKSSQNGELKREVIRKFFYTVMQVGISKEDFVYIIENTRTNLTVPDCYYWPPYIAGIAKNIRFVN